MIYRMLACFIAATLTGGMPFVSAPAAAQVQYGVIAFGATGQSDGVAYGFAWNFPAEDAAQAEAMNACMSNGGTNCVPLAWFPNSCGALAMDQHGNAQGKPGMTQDQAEARALQGCEAAFGGAGCNIVGSVCTAPGGDPGTYSGRENVLPAQEAQATVTERADESPAREEPAPLQDAQTAVTESAGESLAPHERVLIQQALNALGFDAGPADGVFGPRTLAAVYYWQRASGHETTGQLTREQAAALIAQAASIATDEASPEQDEESPPIPDANATPDAEREAAGNVLHFGPETGPKCTGMSKGAECWRELADKPGCYYFERDYSPSIPSPSWSGMCADAGAGPVAVGQGTMEIEYEAGKGIGTGTMLLGFFDGHWAWRWPGRSNEWASRGEGPYVDGEQHGRWVYRFPDGAVEEGPYVDGKQHGRWVLRYPDGTVFEADYVNGESNW